MAALSSIGTICSRSRSVPDIAEREESARKGVLSSKICSNWERKMNISLDICSEFEFELELI